MRGQQIANVRPASAPGDDVVTGCVPRRLVPQRLGGHPLVAQIAAPALEVEQHGQFRPAEYVRRPDGKSPDPPRCYLGGDRFRRAPAGRAQGPTRRGQFRQPTDPDLTINLRHANPLAGSVPTTWTPPLALSLPRGVGGGVVVSGQQRIGQRVKVRVLQPDGRGGVALADQVAAERVGGRGLIPGALLVRKVQRLVRRLRQ